MSDPGNAPPGSPCAECDCPGLDPGQSGAARFCAVCGHPVEAHRPPAPAPRPCLDCSCAAFDDGGSAGARFCAVCGHASERHPAPAQAAGAPPPPIEYGVRIQSRGAEHGLSADREASALRPSEVAPPDAPTRAAPQERPAVIPAPASLRADDPGGARYRKLRLILVAVAVVAALVAGLAGLGLLLTGDDSPRRASRSSEPAPPVDPDAVEKVIDGTTFRLGSGERIKLAQIDSPKVPTGDCYSAEAVTALSELLPAGTKVVLRPEPKLGKKDKFGRRLAHVFVGPTHVNLEMVRRGAAAPYFFFGRRGRFADELLQAGRLARRADRGLWGACPGTALDPVHQVHTTS